MEKHNVQELNVNSFEPHYRSAKRSSNLPPNLQSAVEDLFLKGSPPVWLTTIPLTSNSIKLIECRQILREDSSHDYKSSMPYDVANPMLDSERSMKTGKYHLAKDARDAKEDVGRSMKNYSWKKGEDEEKNELRTLYHSSWAGEADEQMICFAEGGAKSWDDDGPGNEKGIQQEWGGGGSTKANLMGKNRESGELGVFRAEKYFSEAGEVYGVLEGIEEDGVVSDNSYMRSEPAAKAMEDRSIGWGNETCGVLLSSPDNASLANIPSPCKSPNTKKGSNNKKNKSGASSVSGKLGSMLSRFKLSLSSKTVRESKTTESKLIMPTDRHPARSSLTSSDSRPSIGSRMKMEEQKQDKHEHHHPPPPPSAAAPHLFYNGTHTLPPNGKPPSIASRRSISSLRPPQPSSPSSSSSAPISVAPSSCLDEYPHPTFLFKQVAMDASHSSSLHTTPHRSSPSREGLQTQRNDRADVPQLINPRKQQTSRVDNHLPNWNLVNVFPPCSENKPSLFHEKKNNREALQRGFNQEALRAYADHVSFPKEKADSYESDSSSDLFELDRLGEVGMGFSLPVFGTSD